MGGLAKKGLLSLFVSLSICRAEEVVLYLASSSVPPKTVLNVIADAKKLGVPLHVILRGLSKDTFPWLKQILKEGYEVRINPFFFRRVRAEVVPVFVFARCKDGVMEERCEILGVLWGDTSLRFALRKAREVGIWKR